MRDMIGKFYVEALDEVFDDRFEDLRRAVDSSGRKEIFLDRMTDQIRKIEKRRTKKGRIKLTREKIKSLVKDFVKLYCQAAIKKREIELGIHEEESKSRAILNMKISSAINVNSVGSIVTPSGIVLPGRVH